MPSQTDLCAIVSLELAIMSEPSTTNVEALKENETVTNEWSEDTTGSKISKHWTGTVIDVDHE